MKRKAAKSDLNSKVFYYDLYGEREIKYDFLWNNTIDTVPLKKLKPSKEYFFFLPKDFSLKANYDKGLKIDEIFQLYSSGVKTHRDNLLVSIEKNILEDNIKLFFKSDRNDVIARFNLKDTRDWNIDSALKNGRFQNSKISIYSYKPFDNRFIYYDLNLIERGTNRIEIMQHFFEKNLGLCYSRGIKSNSFDTAFITKNISDIHLTGGLCYIAPLYKYQNKDNNNNSNNDFVFKDNDKRDNFTNEFRHFIKKKYKRKYAPEQILGYIYAVLHSPAYSTKYIEFLKIDFPRVPFTDDEKLFQKLLEAGWELVEHHLLKKSYAKTISQLKGTGSNYKVEKVEYDNARVWINKERYFEPVPEPVWKFYIGGYQVLDKWLKERKKHGIILSGEDIQHFIKVVNVLDYTIKAMNEIDILSKEWI